MLKICATYFLAAAMMLLPCIPALWAQAEAAGAPPVEAQALESAAAAVSPSVKTDEQTAPDAPQTDALAAETQTMPDPAKTAAPAASSTSPLKPVPSFSSGSLVLALFKTLLAFALVMGLLILALKLLKKYGRFKPLSGPSAVMSLKGVLPLDNRKYLAAVELDGRMIVVGVTPDKIVAVTDWRLDQNPPASFAENLEQSGTKD